MVRLATREGTSQWGNSQNKAIVLSCAGMYKNGYFCGHETEPIALFRG
jgi:hypothetical protein